MNPSEERAIATLTAATEAALAGRLYPHIDPIAFDDPCMGQLYDAVRGLLEAISGSREFVSAISRGELDAEPPANSILASQFRQLQANLRHLAWQTQQIAKGNLSQRVAFLGEFSVAFNQMTESLREKRRLEEELQRANLILEQQATTDALTGVFNRMKLSELLGAELVRAKRYGVPFSLVMLDIDRFKSVNDTFGHQTGDVVIKEVARRISANIRSPDSFARWGGEEFMILAPDTTLEQAMVLAGKLREIVADSEFEGAGQVTSSFGVSAYSKGDTIESLTHRADEALYRAKSGGRNRVEGP